MTTYLNVGGGGPDEIINVAIRIRSAGDDFVGTAQSLVQSIESIEGGQPWGSNDKYATAFLEHYKGKAGSSGMPTNEAVKRSVGDSGTSLSNIGSGVIEAMAKYQVVDDDGSTSIASAQRSA